MPETLLSHLECGSCAQHHRADVLQTVCHSCAEPLLARYHIDKAPTLREVLDRSPGQFRLHELMPTEAGADTPTLGEGATPLVRAIAIGPRVWIKDEAQNPTGTFKARGMAVAIARAVELGVSAVTLPSNGNAGSAAAAYGALHSIAVDVVMPDNTPPPLLAEAQALGATVTTVPGSISEAAALARERSAANGWLNLATLAEPFRVEGKKMMGYEIFWDLGRLPDVIIYPTGGGTGLVGMVKAFDEMTALGWIDSQGPRMVAVQVRGCAPIVRAWEEGAETAERWSDPETTTAYGLRVPKPLGDQLILKGLRHTNGIAVAVTEEALLKGTDRLAGETGIWGSPESGACVAALEGLTASGWITPDETVVLFNTGTALKYLS